MSIKVSVCIPVYGVEKYIERCARSLFEQTMRDGIEFVFVNDCTPDKSIEILERVLAEYPHRKEQTKIINLPENGGVARARRIAIENCTGEYIIHCDPDDWVELDMYEKMYNAAKENDADMVYCDYSEYINDKAFPFVVTSADNGNALLDVLVSQEGNPFLWNKLYKQHIAKHYHKISDCNMGEDIIGNALMLSHTGKVFHLKEPLYYYRNNRKSMTQSRWTRKTYNELIQGCCILDQYLSDEKYSSACAAIKWRIAGLFLMHNNILSKKEFYAFYKKLDLKKLSYFPLRHNILAKLIRINYRAAIILKYLLSYCRTLLRY